MSEPKNQESRSAICKQYQMSHRGGHTHARDKLEPWLPIKYTVDPCQITIKSSREQYTAELHLEIRKIYIESIHLLEVDSAGWLYFRARATTSKSSKLG
jgi:hypothetical protein